MNDLKKPASRSIEPLSWSSTLCDTPRLLSPQTFAVEVFIGSKVLDDPNPFWQFCRSEPVPDLVRVFYFFKGLEPESSHKARTWLEWIWNWAVTVLHLTGCDSGMSVWSRFGSHFLWTVDGCLFSASSSTACIANNKYPYPKSVTYTENLTFRYIAVAANQVGFSGA